MKPYQEQLALAQRWQKCVDFGSPHSAWTDNMLTAWREAKGDIHQANLILKQLQEAHNG